MDQSVLDRIDRKLAGTYIFRLSLLGFTLTGLGVLALVIKLWAFTGSASAGYILFIIRNLLISLILYGASRFMRNDNTRFAVSFDRADGWIKLSWLVGFAVATAFVYELPRYLLR